MRVRALLFVLPLLAACSTARPAVTPSATLPAPAGGEIGGGEIAGRWTGSWTGTGIFNSNRRDAVSVDFVQQGDVGQGRLVLEGTGAAESVPWEIRRAGQWGTIVTAKVSERTVKLRHQLDERLFAVDLELSEDGQRMAGLIRGTRPAVGLLLTREPAKAEPAAPEAQQAAVAPPEPEPVKPEPEPPVIAMVPEQKLEPVVETPAETSAETPAETSAETAAETPARPKQEELSSVADLPAIHFDFDKADLRPDALDRLQGHAQWLKTHADVEVLIEGHCDEKGTAEYNVALGERRAKSVRDYFTAAFGIPAERITTVSYGKERQACAADTPDCHEMNRRAEFRVKGR